MTFPPRHPSRRDCVFLIFASLLVGCDSDSDDNAKVVASQKIEDLPKWLTPKDTIEPSVWLRSREVGHDVQQSDPEVDRLRRAMHQAVARFYEDPRMIANRTAQTADMLAEAGQPERVVDIMTGMVDVADASVAKKLYGEMCAHYLNLRKNGEDRTHALAQLTARYHASAETH